MFEISGRSQQREGRHPETLGHPRQGSQMRVALAALKPGDRYGGDVGLLGKLALGDLLPLANLPYLVAEASLGADAR